jgi:hypothetical protein
VAAALEDGILFAGVFKTEAGTEGAFFGVLGDRRGGVVSTFDFFLGDLSLSAGVLVLFFFGVVLFGQLLARGWSFEVEDRTRFLPIWVFFLKSMLLGSASLLFLSGSTALTLSMAPLSSSKRMGSGRPEGPASAMTTFEQFSSGA